jgi:polar amino acid transport system substrate-binding protein
MNMKKTLVNASRFTIMFLLLSNLCFAEQVTIKVGVQDNDGAPLTMGSGAHLANPPGIGLDIILLVAKELNIKLEIVRKPNNRVHASFAQGVFDGSGFYSHKKSREKEGVFPRMADGSLDKNRRVLVQSYYMYAVKGHAISWDGEKVTGVRSVGANTGYSVVDTLKALNIPVQEAKTTWQNLERLSLNRVQAYAAHDSAIDPVIATYDEWKNLVKVGPPIRTKEYYFMFSHQFYNNNKEIAEKFWDKIAEVREPVIQRYRDMKIKPKLR